MRLQVVDMLQLRMLNIKNLRRADIRRLQPPRHQHRPCHLRQECLTTHPPPGQASHHPCRAALKEQGLMRTRYPGTALGEPKIPGCRLCVLQGLAESGHCAELCKAPGGLPRSHMQPAGVQAKQLQHPEPTRTFGTGRLRRLSVTTASLPAAARAPTPSSTEERTGPPQRMLPM